MILHESEESDDGERLVPIESYQNLILAELAKNRLIESGIFAETRDEMMGSFYNQAVGGIRLMVKSRDLDSARKVLDSNVVNEASDFKNEDEITSNIEYCSKCHSKKLIETKIIGTGILDKTINMVMGFKKIARCSECGNEWKK